MTSMEAKQHTLTIRRNLELPGAAVTVDCRPGTITILNDEHGGSIPKYCRALSSQAGEERFSLELGGLTYQASEHTLVGFDRELPDSMSITQLLQQKGFRAEEIETIIDTYDLRPIHYLHCAQLPETAKRQVQLLCALRTSSEVLVLNDPFLPFNGRWREAFAALLREHVLSTKRVCVITNLSFGPKCWIEVPEIKTIDVGVLAERALKKAQEQLLKQEAEKERTSRAVNVSSDDVISQLASESEREREELTGLPRIAWYAYSETKDFIFNPLARISRMFRSFGGAAAAAGFAFLVLVMGVVMFPYLSKQRAIIAELASKIDVSWSDIKNEIVKPENKVVEQTANALDSKETKDGEAVSTQSTQESDLMAESLSEELEDTQADERIETAALKHHLDTTPHLMLPALEMLRINETNDKADGDQLIDWFNSCQMCQSETNEYIQLATALSDFSYEFDHWLASEESDVP